MGELRRLQRGGDVKLGLVGWVGVCQVKKKRRLGISDQGKHISKGMKKKTNNKGMEGISRSFTTLGGCKISKVLRGYDLNSDLSILSC